MSPAARTLSLVLCAVLAVAASLMLSRGYQHADVRHGVEAVQAHLYRDGGEARLVQLLEASFELQRPSLEWRGRVVSNVYGVVEVTLTARDRAHAVGCVWEMGLISGELVARNDAAATLLRAVVPVAAGDGG